MSLEYLGGNRRDVDRLLACERTPAVGEIEQRVDQALLPHATSDDALAHLAQRGGVCVGIGERNLDQRALERDRCTQLVRDIGREVAPPVIASGPRIRCRALGRRGRRSGLACTADNRPENHLAAGIPSCRRDCLSHAVSVAWNRGDFVSIPVPSNLVPLPWLEAPGPGGSGYVGNPCARMQWATFNASAVFCWSPCVTGPPPPCGSRCLQVC